MRSSKLGAYHLSYAITFLAVVAVILISGCGDGLPTMKEMNSTNMRRLHSAYQIYMRAHGLEGPADENDLKTFLTTDATAQALLERMGIPTEEIPDIFVSERDGQPFKIRWGLKGIRDHAMIFETEGVDGKRMVAFSRPRELESGEYEKYWTGELLGAMPGQRENDPGNPGPTKAPTQ